MSAPQKDPLAARPLEDQDLVWARAFLMVQIGCQLALLTPTFGSMRVIVRALTFVSSLFYLIAVARRGTPHPAERPALACVGIVLLELFHPFTNSMLSGCAQASLNVAIIAPLYWASRFTLRVRDLRQLILILWLFHVASSTVGILQALFPGRFQPNVSAFIAERPEYRRSLEITLANGERILRPMGLTDVPGGASNAGFYAILFGIAFLIISERPIFQALCASTLVIAMSCIYLSQVRATFVRLAICLGAYVAILAARGRLTRFGVVGAASAGVLAGGYSIAVAIGGDSVVKRYSTVFNSTPADLYYKNRGFFVEHALTEELPEYPLGAGLGRYGMMNAYFGEHGDPRSGHLHVEVQFSAWIYDGGLPLTILYLAAIMGCLVHAWRLSAYRGSLELQLWGGLLFAYNLGTLALCFSYAVFSGQGGIEFWFLNGIVFAAAERHRRGLAAARARSSAPART